MNINISREQIIIHPGSGTYICRVLNIRYPNIHFSVPDETDKYIYARPAGHPDEQIDRNTMDGINDAIAVLTILWQLTGGKVGKLVGR